MGLFKIDDYEVSEEVFIDFLRKGYTDVIPPPPEPEIKVRKKRIRNNVDISSKVCYRCKLEKDISNFLWLRKSERWKSWCRSCVNEDCRKYRCKQ